MNVGAFYHLRALVSRIAAQKCWSADLHNRDNILTSAATTSVLLQSSGSIFKSIVLFCKANKTGYIG